MTISMDKQYTSNGRPVRILCTDKGGDFPIVAIVGEEAHTFTLEGKFMKTRCSSDDLKEIWTPTKGELCYFWDFADDVKGLAVRKFKTSLNTECHIDTNNAPWKHCAPFDGNLPEGFVK
jgi:hypothetical protein